MVSLIAPKFKHGYNPTGVYRIDFSTGHFYIGGSVKVKTRIISWRTKLKRGANESKIFTDFLQTFKPVNANLTILEYPEKENLLERETYHIAAHWDNPMLLNRSPTAFDNKGLKPLPDHLKKPKKTKVKKERVLKPKKEKRKDLVWIYSKPVVQLSMDGKFIRSHKSIADAARFMKIGDSSMKSHLRCRRVYGLKGFVFREIGGIEIFEIIKPRLKEQQLINLEGKPVIDLNTGVFYMSAAELGKFSGIKMKKLYKLLSGEIPNRTQYRYA